MRKRCLFVLGLLPLAAAWNGCVAGEDTAGVDDFPNTVYASVAGFVDQAQEPAGLQTIPPEAQALMATDSVLRALDSANAAPAPAARAGNTLAWVLEKRRAVRAPLTLDSIGVEYDSIWGHGALRLGPIDSVKVVRRYDAGGTEIILLTDADGDGDIRAADDSSRTQTVFLDYRGFNVATQPWIAEHYARLKLRVRYRAASQILEFSAKQTFVNGKTRFSSLLNLQHATDLDRRDTLWARTIVLGAPGDNTDSLITELKMTLDPAAHRESDRSHYVNIVRVNRQGDIRRGTLGFQPILPLAPGARPANGLISLRLEYADGTTVILEGTLGEGALDSKVTDRQGRRYRIHWNAQGKVLTNVRDS